MVEPTHKAFPWILIQESQHHVESGSSPALQAVGITVNVAGMPCDCFQVPSSHAGRQERLLPVAPGAVGNQRASVLTYPPGKLTRTMLEQHITPAKAAGMTGVDRLARLGAQQAGNSDVPGQGRWFLTGFNFYISKTAQMDTVTREDFHTTCPWMRLPLTAASARNRISP